MIYCTKCRAQNYDTAQFCQSCGMAVANKTTPPDKTQQAISKEDAESNKGMAILSYILFFIPLLTGDHKKSPFVKFHVNQGTVLFITMAAIGIGSSILMAILRAVFFNWFAWGILGVFSAILNLVWILPMILTVIGIINASSGKAKHLPVIGNKFTIIK